MCFVFSLYEQENVKDEDVEEELSPAPITTTTTSTVQLEIILDDGESGVQVWIIFRSDQTVRDIRNRIAWFRPEDKKEYYLKSDTEWSTGIWIQLCTELLLVLLALKFSTRCTPLSFLVWVTVSYFF